MYLYSTCSTSYFSSMNWIIRVCINSKTCAFGTFYFSSMSWIIRVCFQRPMGMYIVYIYIYIYIAMVSDIGSEW